MGNLCDRLFPPNTQVELPKVSIACACFKSVIVDNTDNVATTEEDEEGEEEEE